MLDRGVLTVISSSKCFRITSRQKRKILPPRIKEEVRLFNRRKTHADSGAPRVQDDDVGRRRKTTTTTRIDQLRTFHAQCLRDESIPPPLCTARRPTRTFLRLYNVARRGGVPPSQANRETKEVEVSQSGRQIQAYRRSTRNTRLFTARPAHESKEGSCARQRVRNENPFPAYIVAKRWKPLLPRVPSSKTSPHVVTRNSPHTIFSSCMPRFMHASIYARLCISSLFITHL